MTKRKKNKQSGGSGSNKRAKPGNFHGDDDAKQFDSVKGYIDPNTGQRGAFPGLDDGGDEFFGPPADGLDYLRMVRSEAKGVPSLLLSAATVARAPPPRESKPLPRRSPPRGRPVVAQTDDAVLDYDDPPIESTRDTQILGDGEVEDECERGLEEEESDDPNYYFTESTYISLHPSAPSPTLPPHHISLLERFKSVRNSFHSPSYPSIPLPSTPLPSWRGNRAWRDFVTNTLPHPSWLKQLSHYDVLRLVKWFTHWIDWRLRVRNAIRKGIARGWAVWIWGILVRCEEALGAEDMATVRELAKVCARMKAKMKTVEEDQENTDDDRGEEDVDGGVVDADVHEDEMHSVPEVPLATSASTASNTAIADQLRKLMEAQKESRSASQEPIENISDKEPAKDEAESPHKETPAIQEDEREDGELPAEPASATGEEANMNGRPKYYDLSDTMVMLDMVVSIIGDFFGQRDLLDGMV